MPPVHLVIHVLAEKPTRDNAARVVINTTVLCVDGLDHEFACNVSLLLQADFPGFASFSYYRGRDPGSSTVTALRLKFADRPFDDVMEVILPDAPYDEFFGFQPTGGLPPRMTFIAVAQAPSLPRQIATLSPEIRFLNTTYGENRENALLRVSPSVAAKSTEYSEIQASPYGLLDGRFAADGPDTAAYPVELFHPAFAAYKRDAENPALDVPEACVRHVAALMRSLSAVATLQTTRDTVESREILGKILDCFFERLSNSNKTNADCTAIIPTPIDSINAATVIVEIKPELGTGGSDPSTQVSFSYQQFFCSPEREALLNQSNCPSFLIGLAGPWIVICGAVTNHRTIVQRLSAYEWHACSRLGDDAQVLKIARRLFALRNAIAELKVYYAGLKRAAEDLNLNRFFPSRTSYHDENNSKVDFRYVKPLQQGVCIVFLVQRLDAEGGDVEGGELVVKFVSRYNADAHRHMAAGGFAPRLLGYEPLGAGYGDWALVAMERVHGETIFNKHGDGPLPVEVRSAVGKALEHLRLGKYIMPDLRRPNVMIVDGGVRFVDFDWACVEGGGARYPFHLSREIRESSGAKDYEVITREHEENMFQKNFQ